jgi:hypothetical protein
MMVWEKMRFRSAMTLDIKASFTHFPIVWPCIVTDSLWRKPTDALNSSFIGITTPHVSGSLSAHHQEFLAVHRLWYILCSYILLLVANGSSQLHKMYQSRCTVKNSWWWAERMPETCRVVIPIDLEFSASVGFIQKEQVLHVWWVRRKRGREKKRVTIWV